MVHTAINWVLAAAFLAVVCVYLLFTAALFCRWWWRTVWYGRLPKSWFPESWHKEWKVLPCISSKKRKAK